MMIYSIYITVSDKKYLFRQASTLHALYDIIVIEIFEAKFVVHDLPQEVVIKALRYEI